MKKIIIDLSSFALDNPKLKGLVSGIKLLNDKNIFYELKFENSSDKVCITQILELEDLAIRHESPNDIDSIFVITDNANYKNSNTIIVLDEKSDTKNVGQAIKKITEVKRIAEHQRNTKETKIKIKIELDGEGKNSIKTGIGFFDHMLEQIAKHANTNLYIDVDGDLHIDEHHTVEDVGITLGETILKALGNKTGITRYGCFLPMDETIAKCALDLGGRTYLNFKCNFKREMVGEFPTELTEEFFRGLASGLKANLYLRSKGKNDHHKIEAMFKAFAKSLNEALQLDERTKGIPSTKGVI